MRFTISTNIKSPPFTYFYTVHVTYNYKCAYGEKMKKFLLTLLLLCVLTGFILCFPELLDHFYTTNQPPSEELAYQGVLTIGDTVRRTVAGSRYGYINNLIDGFEKSNPRIRVELKQLKYSDSDEIALRLSESEAHPDILPYYIFSEPIDKMYLCDATDYLPLTADMTPYFTSLVESGAYPAVPVSYEVPTILINNDILRQHSIDIPDTWTAETFLAMLRELDEVASDDIYVFDAFIAPSSNTWQPFYENGHLQAIAELTHLRSTLFTAGEDTVISMFADDRTAVCLIQTGQLRTLQNMHNKGSATSTFSVYPLPYETTYISNIYFYAAFQSEDMAKQAATISLIEHMLNTQSQTELQNLMHLPVTDVLYEDYPYLEPLKHKETCVLLPLDNAGKQVNYDEMMKYTLQKN